MIKKKHNYNESDVARIISLALNKCGSLEAIAAKLDKSHNTIYRWSKGKSLPQTSDWKMLNIIAGVKKCQHL